MTFVEGKYGTIKSGGKHCEKIACNARDPISKAVDKIPQDNQRERYISNQVGYPRDKLYRHIFQAWIPLDKKYVGQGEVELLTLHHCPSI